MNYTNDIFNDMIHAPSLFSHGETADWGVFYCCPENPLSYGANQAVVLPGILLNEAIFAEIREYFRGRGMVPRVFLPGRDPGDRALAAMLEAAQFEVSAQRISACMVKSEKRTLLPKHYLKVRAQEEYEERLTENVIGAGYDKFLPGELRRSLLSPAFHLFAGYLADEPVSMCCIRVGEAVSCLYNVKTGMGFRRCGFAGQVVSAALDAYDAISQNPLYLLTENPSAVPLYRALGFAPVPFPEALCYAVWKGQTP